MLGKKLLTAGCALGILAIGACFGPIVSNPPPPPPLRPLEGVRTIRVVVTNASETQHITASRLENSVILQINNRFGREMGGLHAISSDDAGSADATLSVTILNESAHRVNRIVSVGQAEWKVTCKSSATLTANNGDVIWSDADLSLMEQFFLDHASDTGATMNWDAPFVKRNALYMLASNLVEKMVYLKPSH